MDLAQQLQQLYSQFGDVSGINIELHKELVAVSIENEAATALIFLQGAQLVQYQAKGHAETLWLSPECDYRAGTTLRGGIPVCWPWFGDLAHNPEHIQQQCKHSDSPPAHGFVRNRNWRLDKISRLDQRNTEVTLSIDIAAGTPHYWPYNCQLSICFSIGEQLTIDFKVKNNDRKTLCYSAALHSYFAVANVEEALIEGLEGCQYLDCRYSQSHVDEANASQQGAVTISQETDRLYYTANNTLSLKDRQRATQLSTKGSHSCVVWNPWIEKSKRLSGFNPQAYKEMLCIETANAGSDFINLQPKQQHSMSLTIANKEQA